MLTSKVNGVDGTNTSPSTFKYDPGSRPTLNNTAPAAAAQNRKSAFEGMNCDGAVLVGAGATVSGNIANSSIVEIQGTLEGNVITSSLVVRKGGVFKGDMQAESAEVHGVIEGTLSVQDLLDIRASGRVSAEATYGRLAVAAGGSIAGNVQVRDTRVQGAPSHALHAPVDAEL